MELLNYYGRLHSALVKMRLSRREQAMKEGLFDRVMLLAIIVFLPCAVYAQEDGMMSFSEEEVEEDSQPAESENDADMSFDAEETESQGEDSEGAGKETTSDADILSALGEGEVEGGATATPGEAAGEEEAAAHPIWAVQRIYALHAGRVDLQPSFGISMNDPYVQHQAISAGLSYFITEILAVGVSFNFYHFFNATSEVNFRLSRATHQTVPINEYSWAGQLNFTYIPMYGKFAMFTEWILHWDVWLMGGGGFIFTRPIPVIDPEYRDFDWTMKFCFNVGIGGRLFLSKFLAIFLEVRDYIFPEELESLDTYSRTEDREDKSKWLDDDLKLTNNVMLQVGVSLFIPFTFDYKLPK